MALCSTTLSRGLRHCSPIASVSFSSGNSSAVARLSLTVSKGLLGSITTGQIARGKVHWFSTKTTLLEKMQARKITLAQNIQGAPKLTDFKVVEETLPELQDGEILCKAEWLTVDPYMRPATVAMKPGDQMPGGQVARVIKSRSKDFPEGSQVVGNFGWRDLTITKVLPESERSIDTFHAMPEMKGLPDSYALGCMGMPGNTAYFGLTRICNPKAGETLVVSAAAGAVGSLVGQIGKIIGLNVIGYAGTDDKVQWLKTLGFDHAFNYKTEDLRNTLKSSATNGVDCYFDNVGGEFSFHVTRAMNQLGRISLCGAISVYNADPRKPSLGKNQQWLTQSALNTLFMHSISFQLLAFNEILVVCSSNGLRIINLQKHKNGRICSF